MALAAMVSAASLPFVAFSVQANTADTFISGTSLTTATDWSLGTVPTVTNDAIFSSATVNTTLTLTSNTLTVGSLDDTRTSSTVTIANTSSTTTASTFVLGGTGTSGNGVAGAATTDLIFVGGSTAGTTTFNLSGGTAGVLNFTLGQSGTFNSSAANSILNIGTTNVGGVITNAGFTITTTGAGVQNIGSNISGSGGVTIAGTGTVTFTSQYTYTGATTINAGGVLSLTNQSSAASTKTFPAGTFTDNGTLIINPTLTNTYNSATAIGGSGAVIKTGTGQSTITGAATYTGATTVNGGLLLLNNAAIPATSLVTVNTGGAFGTTAYSNVTALLASGKISTASTGAVTINTNPDAENLDFSSTGAQGAYPTLFLGDSINATYTGTLTPSVNGYLLGGGSGSLTIPNALNGANNLTVGANGNGSVFLTGANLYTGATLVNATLNVGNGTSGSINNSSGVTVGTSGLLRINMANGTTFTPNIVNSGTVSGTNSVGVNDTISGNISGSGAFTQSGTGTTTLSGTNSYTGATNVNSGGVVFTNTASASTGSVLNFGSASATANLGGNSITFAGLNTPASSTVSGGQTNVITNGSLTITGAANFNPQETSGTNTENLSGLTSFTQNAATANFIVQYNGSASAVTNVLDRVILSSGTNAITSLIFNVGNQTAANLETGTIPTMQVDLGTTNTLNTGTGGIIVGGNRNNGILDFQTGLTNPTVNINGPTAGSAVGTFIVGQNNGANGSNSGSVDFSGTSNNGTVNAVVTTLDVGLQNVTTAQTATGTFTMASGVVDATTIQLASSISAAGASASTQGVTGDFNQNAGTVVAQTLSFGNSTNTLATTTPLTSNYALGTSTTSGVLSATTIEIGSGAATATIPTLSRATLTFNNGTIENYDPALATGVTAGTVGSATATDLTIGGLTGGGAGSNSTTMNIVLAGTTAHNFLAESGHLITVNPTALISGTGGLNTTGPGTVIFNGTNTYTGATAVNNGTLLVNGNTSAGTMAVASGATLGGGTKAATGTVGATTVAAGGTITAGTVGTTGTLTLASLAMSGTYQVDINSTSATGGDLLTITGGLSGSGATVNINSGSLDGTSTYVIATYGSDTGDVFSTLTGANGYALDETATMLELVPVPEPSTYVGGLILVAALGWSVRGRFTRRSA